MPTPTDEEVHAVAERTANREAALLRKRGRTIEDVCVHVVVFDGLWQQRVYGRRGDVGLFDVHHDKLLDREP